VPAIRYLPAIRCTTVDGELFNVLGLIIRRICTIFATNPLSAQYRVRAGVLVEVFPLFLSSFKREVIEVTKADFSGFSALCGEFVFELNRPSYRLEQAEEVKADITHLSEEVAQLRVGLFVPKGCTVAPDPLIFP
jgi:hypothetical protein